MAAENIMAKPKSNITPKSHHNIVHLHAPTNDPSRNQLSKPYSFQDIAAQYFKGQGYYGKVKGQINVTPLRCTPTTLTPYS